MKGFGYSVDQKSFGESGHPFEKEVAGGEERDEGPFDDDILSYDDFLGSFPNCLEPF